MIIELLLIFSILLLLLFYIVEVKYPVYHPSDIQKEVMNEFKIGDDE